MCGSASCSRILRSWSRTRPTGLSGRSRTIVFWRSWRVTGSIWSGGSQTSNPALYRPQPAAVSSGRLEGRSSRPVCRTITVVNSKRAMGSSRLLLILLGLARVPVRPRGSARRRQAEEDRGRDPGRLLPDQRPADLCRAAVARALDRGAAAQRPDGPGDLRRPRAPNPCACGPTPIPDAGTPSGTPASSSPRCPSGGATACSPSRSTSRAAAPRATRRGASPGTTRRSTNAATLRPDFMARLERILDRADELGMVVILGIFYFGQDERLADEAAVIRGLDHAVDWVLDRSYRNVLIEVNNECNVQYDHAILRPERVHELIARVQGRSAERGRRLLVGHELTAAARSPALPSSSVSDFLLLHGNGVADPERIAGMVKATRQVAGYRPVPDPVQRGRPLRVRQAAEQLHRRGRRARLVGLLRPRREQLPRRLPVAPGSVGDQHRAKAGVLRHGEGDRRGLITWTRRPCIRSSRPSASSRRSSSPSWCWRSSSNDRGPA